VTWLLAGSCIGGEALAITPGTTTNRYEKIPERNLFGLKEPVGPVVQPQQPPQLPKLILTGITTILNSKRALLKLLPVGAGPADAAKALSLILTEGQSESGVEILEINEKANTVRVNNSGTPMTLDFDKDGVKTPAANQGPGQPQPPQAAPTPPGVAAVPPPTGAPNVPMVQAVQPPGTAPMPSRSPRAAAAAAAAAQNAPPLPPEVPAQSRFTPEQQAVLQAVQHEMNQAGQNPAPSNTVLPTPGAAVTPQGAPVMPQ